MIRTRGKGVIYGELWFDEELTPPFPDILICRQRSQPWPGTRGREFITLLLDLEQDETQLLNTFGKSNRYKINRAETKDGGVSQFMDAPASNVEPFCDFFNEFARARGLAPAHREWLHEAAANGNLVLTRAEQQQEIQVWHAYFVSGDRARLLHSASHFRAQDKDLQAAIGRLNRWLHWRDMLDFKHRGYRIYDFGGIFSQDASGTVQGVNRFKSEFGGVQSRTFDCSVGLTLKGRLYLSLRSMCERLSQARLRR